jgi:hypothetical protein
MSNAFNIKRTATNGDGVSLNSVAHPRPTSKIDVIIDALSVAQNSVWSALNQEALAYAVELKTELAKPEQEPIGWFLKDHLETYMESYKDIEGAIPLYAAPPRKPWVGLTGTEINHIFAANVGYPERMCRAIEAKLKEKNEH